MLKVVNSMVLNKTDLRSSIEHRGLNIVPRDDNWPALRSVIVLVGGVAQQDLVTP